MSLRTTWWRSAIGVAFIIASAGALYAYQQRFRVYPSTERYDDVALPPDYQEPAEFVFARLMYPTHPQGILGGRRFGFGGFSDWREGGTSWTQDYPRADRHFAAAVRRLTRIHVRSTEQPSNPDDLDDFYNWPWLAAGEMGDWKLTGAQAKTLREYLLRGGFLMLDDFWGAEEFARFEESMKLVFPERPVVDIDNADSIFHVVYDLDDRFQILGTWAMPGWGRGGGGGMMQRAIGTKAHWMGIYDDRQRVMVAISFNSDIGDSWEWADDPRYPQEMAALGIRIGVNDVVYAMTH
jgi:hypothetical protein